MLVVVDEEAQRRVCVDLPRLDQPEMHAVDEVLKGPVAQWHVRFSRGVPSLFRYLLRGRGTAVDEVHVRRDRAARTQWRA